MSETQKKPETQKNPKTVIVNIPMGRSKSERGDVFVSANFKNYQIQRGKDVEVPAVVAEVLRLSQEMEQEIANKQY